MQFGPHLFAGFPDHLAETAAGVLQRHDKQARTAVGVCAGFAGGSTKTIIYLGLFPGPKLQPVILGGILFAQPPAKAFHAVVFMFKGKSLNQVLINGYGIAPQAHLLLYPGTVLLTG